MSAIGHLRDIASGVSNIGSRVHRASPQIGNVLISRYVHLWTYAIVSRVYGFDHHRIVPGIYR